MRLNDAEQMEFVENIDKLNLLPNEKKEVFATLKPEVKAKMDKSTLPEDLRTVIGFETEMYTGKIKLDLDRDLEDYKDLDNLLGINPENFTEEQKKRFDKLCDICPNMKICSTVNNQIEFTSTVQEYKQGEEWISSLIESMEHVQSKAQKLAIVDHAIGKKISYSPDFETEVFDGSEARALWKIISTGYGLCNGIARVEQYILSKVGIESEIVGSGKHAFLKLIDMELPLESGEIVKGNTIIDPTWNLMTNRFDGRPNNFCIS